MSGPDTEGGDLLDAVLELRAPAFALLHRPEANGPGLLDVLTGEVAPLRELADIPLPGQREPVAGGGTTRSSSSPIGRSASGASPAPTTAPRSSR
ncbi:hypothetical protein GCM10027612_34960 [Microbispora bryophytorum subsp. camponoti]